MTDNNKIITKIEVVYKKMYDLWYVVLFYTDGTTEDLNTYGTKDAAERRAQEIGAWAADRQGTTVEARFKTKDGKIPAGDHGTATYGRDPEKSKG